MRPPARRQTRMVYHRKLRAADGEATMLFWADWARSDQLAGLALIIAAFALAASVGSSIVSALAYRKTAASEKPAIWAEVFPILKWPGHWRVVIHVRSRSKEAWRGETVHIRYPRKARMAAWFASERPAPDGGREFDAGKFAAEAGRDVALRIETTHMGHFIQGAFNKRDHDQSDFLLELPLTRKSSRSVRFSMRVKVRSIEANSRLSTQTITKTLETQASKQIS